MSRFLLRLLLASLLGSAGALAAGCSSTSDPGQAAAGASGSSGEGGASGAAGAGGAGGAPALESLAAIQKDIFNISCGFMSVCHGPGPAQGGLVLGLSDGSVPPTKAFDDLVNKPAMIDPSLTRVKPGDPDHSFLMAKIIAGANNGDFSKTVCDPNANQCGQGMPMTSATGLMPAQIQRIHDWIEQGAKNN